VAAFSSRAAALGVCCWGGDHSLYQSCVVLSLAGINGVIDCTSVSFGPTDGLRKGGGALLQL